MNVLRLQLLLYRNINKIRGYNTGTKKKLKNRQQQIMIILVGELCEFVVNEWAFMSDARRPGPP